MSETTAVENLGKRFGELKCSYQSFFCNELLSFLVKKVVAVATNMLKQKMNGLHGVTYQHEGL